MPPEFDSSSQGRGKRATGPETRSGESCPICGSDLTASHVCRPAVLRAIDAAHSRGVNREDPEMDTSPEPVALTYNARLRDGFKWKDDV